MSCLAISLLSARPPQQVCLARLRLKIFSNSLCNSTAEYVPVRTAVLRSFSITSYRCARLTKRTGSWAYLEDGSVIIWPRRFLDYDSLVQQLKILQRFTHDIGMGENRYLIVVPSALSHHIGRGLPSMKIYASNAETTTGQPFWYRMVKHLRVHLTPDGDYVRFQLGDGGKRITAHYFEISLKPALKNFRGTFIDGALESDVLLPNRLEFPLEAGFGFKQHKQPTANLAAVMNPNKPPSASGSGQVAGGMLVWEQALDLREQALESRESVLAAQTRGLGSRARELALRERELNSRAKALEEFAAALEHQTREVGAARMALREEGWRAARPASSRPSTIDSRMNNQVSVSEATSDPPTQREMPGEDSFNPDIGRNEGTTASQSPYEPSDNFPDLDAVRITEDAQRRPASLLEMPSPPSLADLRRRGL